MKRVVFGRNVAESSQLRKPNNIMSKKQTNHKHQKL